MIDFLFHFFGNRNAKPSIIFFDEIEALVGSRQSGKTDAVRDRVLTTLLNEMEGVEKVLTPNSECHFFKKKMDFTEINPSLLS